jgi:hypothetical protein
VPRLHDRVCVAVEFWWLSVFLFAAAATETSAQQKVVIPDAEKIVLLVRNTLITLNDAIQTGNFTVLRDRGAPGFREANSAGRLGQIFSDLTSRGVDLSVVSVVTPQLTQSPILDQEKGTLNIKGYFPAPLVHINFEVLYQSVGGRWRLFGLSVRVPKGNANLDRVPEQ